MKYAKLACKYLVLFPVVLLWDALFWTTTYLGKVINYIDENGAKYIEKVSNWCDDK